MLSITLKSKMYSVISGKIVVKTKGIKNKMIKMPKIVVRFGKSHFRMLSYLVTFVVLVGIVLEV